jgi:hypothetical protein
MGGRSGQSVNRGGFTTLSNGVQISNNVNQVPMTHYTTNEAAESIKENGFNIGSNNMYGEGVYFTNEKLTGDRFQSGINVELKNHKQLYVENDFNIYKDASNASGKTINNGFQIRQALLDSGYKSIRVKRDNGEVYTVVLDPSIINIKK